MEIIDELFAVASALDAADVPYAVCGGLAVAIHGCPRLTVDIDLVVPSSHIQNAVKAVAATGFDVETGWVSLAASELGSRRLFRVTKVEGSEYMTLDLLEVDSTENPLWRDRMQVEVAGRTLDVMSRTSLIRMKSSSDRTKDRLDIELLSDEQQTG